MRVRYYWHGSRLDVLDPERNVTAIWRWVEDDDDLIGRVWIAGWRRCGRQGCLGCQQIATASFPSEWTENFDDLVHMKGHSRQSFIGNGMTEVLVSRFRALLYLRSWIHDFKTDEFDMVPVVADPDEEP